MNALKPVKKLQLFNIPLEIHEQFKLAHWLNLKNLLWYHVPNGMHVDKREGSKFKRLGLKPGVPDVVVCHGRKGYHGLYVELKRLKGGVLSVEQNRWLDALNAEGYLAIMCKGADEAITRIEEYLS